MLTIKQLETFYWVARLGTVQRAATRLCITQSAATKRLQELEATAEQPLFEEEKSKARLSNKGLELLELCQDLIADLGRLHDLQSAKGNVVRVLHIGLTEQVAVTWFPHFVRKLSEVYPDIVVQPELLHVSAMLCERVMNGALDIAFLPDVYVPEMLARVELNAVPFSWYCAPGLVQDSGTMPLQDIAAFPVIEQDERSVMMDHCRRLFNEVGVNPRWKHGGRSLFAMAGLIEAGVGVGCLPDSLFEAKVAEGRLQKINTRPAAPILRYCATFLKHPHSSVEFSVAQIAKACSQL